MERTARGTRRSKVDCPWGLPEVLASMLWLALLVYAPVQRHSVAVLLWTPDLDLMCSLGRHLAEVVRAALQPQGHAAGGSPWQWLRTLLGWALFSSLTGWALAQLARRVVRPLGLCRTPLVRRPPGAASAGWRLRSCWSEPWRRSCWRCGASVS